MRTLKHLTTWLLLLTVFLASGVVSAKVASGVQNLSGGLHQAETGINSLWHQAKIGFSYDDASGSPVVAKGVDPSTLRRSHSIEGKRSSKRVNEIADSMRQDGYVGNGIDVVEHNGQRYIVDGHHRAAAARRTGTKVDVNVVDDITNHHSSFNSIDDVVRSANSVGADRLRPPRR